MAFASLRFAYAVDLVWPIMRFPTFIVIFLWWLVGAVLTVGRGGEAHMIGWVDWHAVFKKDARRAEHDDRTRQSDDGIVNRVAGYVIALSFGFVVALVFALLLLLLFWWLVSYSVFLMRKNREMAE